MKINRLLFTLLLVGAVSMANAQYNFVVQNQSAAVYTSLQTAYDSASVGDTIYVPGGSFSFPTPIEKTLTWIGVGYHPDSCSATFYSSITNAVSFYEKTDGTVLEGFHFKSNLSFGREYQVVTNFKIRKCHIDGSISFLARDATQDTALQAEVRECIINGGLTGNYASQVMVENSIVRGLVTEFKSSFFNHCIFSLGSRSTSWGRSYHFSNMSNSLVKNSVINYYQYNNFYTSYGCENNQFKNNAFVTPNVSFPSETNTGENNLTGIVPSDFFEHLEGALSEFSYLNNYQLKTGSVGVGAGVNGVDIGIYGGSNSFKIGGLPNVPHIRSISVADETTNGKLPVQVTVVAQ